MNYTDCYILYPINRVLEHSIQASLELLSDEDVKHAFPDTGVTVGDNFLYNRGNYEQRRYSTAILEPLRDALQATLTDELRDQDPQAWAGTANRLGNILAALGQQQHDAGLYEQAIDCFNQALEHYNPEATSMEWAETQSNLGTAQQALGRLQQSTKLFNAAVDAYTAALLVWTRKGSPEEWLLTMMNLGGTLHSFSKILRGDRNFEKGIVAYRNALAELNADDYAFELTATHNNSAAAKQNLAEAEDNVEQLQEAIKSFETAITVCLEQQLPVHLLALCKVNKSTALGVLAQMTDDKRLADEVADEFEVILEVFPHALQPLCAKHCTAQMNQYREMAGTAG